MKDAIFIAGPTASGKSGVALELARKIGGEIISVDSMQVYRGLDIGTAKPSPEDRRQVPHHLLDVAALTDSFDAAKFIEHAQSAVQKIRDRGGVPIFCGGTGLYFNAWIGGLAPAPSDPALRAELERTPLEVLLAELGEKDSATFATIDRQNPRRVIRAIENLRNGQPKPRWEGIQTGHWFGLERARPELIRRIEARVEQMFRLGLVDETESLLQRGLEQNRTAMQAIGYRQVVEHAKGQRDLASTISLIKTKTRQYAKRQLTWFRHQLRLEWIPVEGDQSPTATAEIMMRKIENKSNVVPP